MFAPHFSRSFSKRKLGGLDEKVDESQVRFYLEGRCCKTKAQTQRIPEVRTLDSLVLPVFGGELQQESVTDVFSYTFLSVSQRNIQVSNYYPFCFTLSQSTPLPSRLLPFLPWSFLYNNYWKRKIHVSLSLFLTLGALFITSYEVC